MSDEFVYGLILVQIHLTCHTYLWVESLDIGLYPKMDRWH